jgi:molybdate transport system ATP-binding protein
VFQSYALFPHLTVADNIAFGIRGGSRDDKRRAMAELTDTMELHGLALRYPEQLSAGQQQRVALARALASEPDILLLDEPLSALDASTREHLEPYILALKRFFRGTILFVTHDVSEAYRLSSRIAVYEAGRIAQCEDKARLVASPANLTVARLTGFRNIFPAEIRSMTDSSFLLDVPGLGVLKTARHANSCLSPGMAVNIGIRNEHVRVVPESGGNTVSGTLEQIVDEIRHVRCVMKADDRKGPGCCIEALLPKSESGCAPPAGSRAHFYFPPEHIIVINQRS